MEVGEARERVKVLDLLAVGDALQWVETGTVWAKVEETGARNLFSSVGLGAGTVVVIIRKRALTLHQMLEHRGQRLFITGILPKERSPGWLEVTTAKVTVRECLARSDQGVGTVFPGVLTEKYGGHRQDFPMASNELRMVLVTPKGMRLEPGSLVEVLDASWVVLVPHELDPYKNEYEIGRTVEL